MSDAHFESEAATPQGGTTAGTYDQALFALQFNQGVAENVFARLAKRELRDLIGDARISNSETDQSPVWVDQQTIVLDASDIPREQPSVDDPATLAALRLQATVRRLSWCIRDTAGEGTIQLVDALQVRVQNIGGDRYSFSVKQKWGVDVG